MLRNDLYFQTDLMSVQYLTMSITMLDEVIAREFLHSTKVETPSGNHVVVSERHYLKDGSTKPVITVHKDPKRQFYIAKPQYRTNTIKRELIPIAHTDVFNTTDSQLFVDAWRVLNRESPRGNMEIAPARARKEVLKSPYVYGVDIDVQALIKYRYMQQFEASKVIPKPPTSGFLDIERDIDTGVIPLITYSHENIVFIAYLNSYGKGLTPDQIEKEFYSLLDPLVDRSADEKPMLMPRYNARPDDRIIAAMKKNLEKHPERKDLRICFVPVVKAFDNEGELICWIWSMIHQCKTSFVGVWNIDFDIPSISERLRVNGFDPEKVFPSPELPALLQEARYEFDKMTADKANAHISDYWHWLHTPGYTQFYDAMALYAKLRKIEAKMPSYALDAVLKREGFAGKLTGGGHGQDWHRMMVNTQFLRYTMYGCVDVMAIQLMEWANTDIATMLTLCGCTHLSKYSRETRKAIDNFYTVWRDKGYILGSCSGDMSNDWDKYLGALGGAVLSPNRMNRSGLRLFRDAPQVVTKVYGPADDIDLSAQYPTAGIVMNICKETKVFTPVMLYGDWIKIKGQPAVELFFTGVINRKTESSRTARTFFNMPSFSEVDAICASEGW